MARAEGTCTIKLRLMHINRYYDARARDPCSLNRCNSDAPTPDHSHSIEWRYPGRVHYGTEAGGYAASDQTCLSCGNIGIDGNGRRFPNYQLFGKAPN